MDREQFFSLYCIFSGKFRDIKDLLVCGSGSRGSSMAFFPEQILCGSSGENFAKNKRNFWDSREESSYFGKKVEILDFPL